MSAPVLQEDRAERRRSGYIPSLDGWRAFAILGVMWTHDLTWHLAGHSLEPLQNAGGSGVDLFFAISGILITTRILEEESIRGYFDVKKFYIRRIFRIQPAAWLYLAVIGVLMAAGVVHILWRHWLGALGMYENFIYDGPANDYQGFFVGHFWSLAVEEHFYILLSLFLLFVKRGRTALLAWTFLGLFAFRVYAGEHGYLTYSAWRKTQYALPALVYGACFASALRSGNFRRWAEQYLRPWIVFAVTIAVVAGREVLNHALWPSPSDFHLSSIANSIGILRLFFFAIWIVSTMLHGGSLATRFLEWTPLRWIGRVSYSLYLWQVLFFFRISPRVGVTWPVLVALSGRPAKYIAAFGTAALSYYFVEKPFMRIGHRLAPPATPGRSELAENERR
jgi:peptidoglycan/LPS O-acetylase OafA/YrhL